MIRRIALAVTACLAGACDSPPAPADPEPGLELVASGLDSPVFLTAPAGDTSRLFVVLQGGVIRAIRVNHDHTLLGVPFLDISSASPGFGERGLLGMAFHPAYATNGFFFINYTNTDGNTRVVRYRVSGNPDVADPGSADTILKVDQPFDNHNGGMLAFGPDGYLYVGLGDGGSGGDPLGHAQNMNSLLGKMLRLDVNGALPYTIPPSNPFPSLAGVRPEIWASGLRNPWRYSFDRLTGDLYIADVGQARLEEINVEPPGNGGRNYGWNVMEGTGCFQPGCSTSGYVLPASDYGRSDGCSVTGGYVYRGERIPRLAGHYLYSDYCGGWVHSFRWNGTGATDHRDWPLLAPGGNVSSFGEDARGELYLIVHGSNGAVYRITPAPLLAEGLRDDP